MDATKVAVIGSGLMGGGIAQACAQAGFTVVNIDIAQEPLDKAEALVGKLLQKKVDKNKMTAEERQTILDRLSYSTDYSEVAGAKFVIEAVPERLDFKQSTFQKVDEYADDDAVLLTNTSGISIDEIAASTKRPESVLGLHFFYPAPVMKLVEIIRGEKTSDEAAAKTHEFADALGKVSVDAPNSSSLNDAAAAVVIMTRAKAEELGCTPMACIRDFAVAGYQASLMGYSPYFSSKKLAEKLDLDLTAIDFFELNEAFASQAFAVSRDLGLDPEKVNIYGGGISIGHPIGATGTILAIKCAYELAQRHPEKQDAMVSMCIGGGQGISMYFTKE